LQENVLLRKFISFHVNAAVPQQMSALMSPGHDCRPTLPYAHSARILDVTFNYSADTF